MTSTDSVGRIAATCAFLLLIPSTIALGKLLDNFTLTSVLLVLFAEVLTVAILSNVYVAVAAAVVAVLAANWFLVLPYYTFYIADPTDVIALMVFIAGAILTSWLVHRAEQVRSAAERSRSEADAFRILMRERWPSSDPTVALRLLMGITGLDEIEIRDPNGSRIAAVEGSVSAAHEDFVVIDEELPDQYLLIGSGPLAVRPDRDVVVALGTAAVRSYETARAIGRK